MKPNLQSLPKSQRMVPPSYAVLPAGPNQPTHQKTSQSPQKFGKPLLHGGAQNAGGQLNRTMNPHKSQTPSKCIQKFYKYQYIVHLFNLTSHFQ